MSLRFLRDERMPQPVVDAIATAGLDVAWLALLVPAIADRGVLELAARQGRVLVTLDKDFGGLATAGPGPGCGSLLIRPPLERPTQTGARVAALDDRGRHLSVIELGRPRPRPLRKSP